MDALTNLHRESSAPHVIHEVGHILRRDLRNEEGAESFTPGRSFSTRETSEADSAMARTAPG